MDVAKRVEKGDRHFGSEGDGKNSLNHSKQKHTKHEAEHAKRANFGLEISIGFRKKTNV